MIKDPPLLTIKRDFARPSAELIARFAGIPTGYLVDAMGGRGCIGHRIKPLAPSELVMSGVAIIAAETAALVMAWSRLRVSHLPLPSDSPLWDLPNVLISPHTAAISTHESRLITELFARNATAFLDGRPLENVVNTVEFY